MKSKKIERNIGTHKERMTKRRAEQRSRVVGFSPSKKNRHFPQLTEEVPTSV